MPVQRSTSWAYSSPNSRPASKPPRRAFSFGPSSSRSSKAAASLTQDAAATKISAVFRGNKARAGLVGGGSGQQRKSPSVLGSLAPRGIASSMRRTAYGKLAQMVDHKMDELYVGKVKVAFTADRRIPWVLRVAAHDVADFVWTNLTEEIVRVVETLKEKGESVEDDVPSPPPPSSKSPPSPPPSPPASSLARLSMRRSAGRGKPAPPPSTAPKHSSKSAAAPASAPPLRVPLPVAASARAAPPKAPRSAYPGGGADSMLVALVGAIGRTLGWLCGWLRRDYMQATIRVAPLSARDLPNMDLVGKTDPYVQHGIAPRCKAAITMLHPGPDPIELLSNSHRMAQVPACVARPLPIPLHDRPEYPQSDVGP